MRRPLAVPLQASRPVGAFSLGEPLAVPSFGIIAVEERKPFMAPARPFMSALGRQRSTQGRLDREKTKEQEEQENEKEACGKEGSNAPYQEGKEEGERNARMGSRSEEVQKH